MDTNADDKNRCESNSKLMLLIEKGYASREAREQIDEAVSDLVDAVMQMFPDQSKVLQRSLDGHRQKLLKESMKGRSSSPALDEVNDNE